MEIAIKSSTPNAIGIVAEAARICTMGTDNYLGNAYTVTQDEALIRRVLGYGHTSILEHASFTFEIIGVSRSLSHQLVRFRIASFSQQSQRYVKGPFNFVTPDSIVSHKSPSKGSYYFENRYNALMATIEDLYQEMVGAGIPAEDARFILPNATCTNLIMTMNARELRHMFSLRCCAHAQWEIRDMTNEMLTLVRNKYPVLFENAGPSCVRGICSEGARSCGKLNKGGSINV